MITNGTYQRPVLTKEKTGALGGRLLDKLAERMDAPLDVKVADERVTSWLSQTTAEDGTRLDARIGDFIDGCIASVQKRLSAQLDAILHDPKVSRLMGSWRSIERLLNDPNMPEDLEFHLKPATKQDLLEDLRNCGGDLKRTQTYLQFVRANYGTPNGIPYLYGIADFPLGPGADDVEIARMLTRIGEKGHFPWLADAAPAFFDAESFADMPLDPVELKERFAGKTFARYREFRKEPYSRYLTLCLPRIYIREPFGEEKQAPGCEWYTETIQSAADLTSGSVAFALGTRIAASMGRFGWPASIIGQDYGGKVGGLTLISLRTGTGEDLENCPTEVVIDDELEVPLEKQGFLSLVHLQRTNTAAFYAAPTTQQALRGRDPNQAASAELAARLPNLLITCRFAHFLRQMLRALIGASKTPQEIQDFLMGWANEYVLENPEGAGDSDRARRPFRRIKITINDTPDQPGHLDALVELEPHFKVSSFVANLVIKAPETGDSEQ